MDSFHGDHRNKPIKLTEKQKKRDYTRLNEQNCAILHEYYSNVIYF